MHYLYKAFLFFLTLLLPLSCSQDASKNGQNASENEKADSLGNLKQRATAMAASPLCQINGEVLPQNRYLSKGQGLYIVLKADSSTRDPELGNSHRILEVYKAENCERLQREVLPVNESPDFPYYLAEVHYNNITQLLAIRGVNDFYLYDLAQRKLRAPATPAFANERYGVDARSGTIRQLEVWEDYLVGYAQHYGAFAFQLFSDGRTEAVLPLAEYEAETQVFHQLFALPSDSSQQLLLPSFEERSNTFRINPVFAHPVNLETEKLRQSENGRFVLLWKNGEQTEPVLLDLLQHKMETIPPDLRQGDAEKIMEWATSANQ